MDKKYKSRCINCSERERCRDDFASWVFFVIGIISTIAMRVVTFLMHTDPLYGKIAWYIGVGGFIVFFIYKFKINQQRSKLINEQKILTKIDKKDELLEEDYKLISGILCSLQSKKERVNYIFIFVLSAVALLIALYIDILK